MPENVSLALALSPDEGTLAVGTSGSADQLLLIDTAVAGCSEKR